VLDVKLRTILPSCRRCVDATAKVADTRQ
jgi:hypothetical protein